MEMTFWLHNSAATISAATREVIAIRRQIPSSVHQANSTVATTSPSQMLRVKVSTMAHVTNSDRPIPSSRPPRPQTPRYTSGIQIAPNPANGSRHNRGCAVDLTLYDLETGQPVPMVAGYDEFSPRSFPRYPGGTARQRWHRQLLRRVMEAEGFTIYEFEWWHFDYQDWRKYRIGNATFEELNSD